MAMDDRDYYRRAWDLRERGDMLGYHTGRSLVKRILKNGSNSLHWVLRLILMCAFSLAVFLLARVVRHLLN